MTPQEFKQSRDELNISIAQMARYLGVTERAARYYENGSRPINKPTQIIIHYMLEYGIDREFYRDLVNSPMHRLPTTQTDEERREPRMEHYKQLATSGPTLKEKLEAMTIEERRKIGF